MSVIYVYVLTLNNWTHSRIQLFTNSFTAINKSSQRDFFLLIGCLVKLIKLIKTNMWRSSHFSKVAGWSVARRARTSLTIYWTNMKHFNMQWFTFWKPEGKTLKVHKMTANQQKHCCFFCPNFIWASIPYPTTLSLSKNTPGWILGFVLREICSI